MRYTYLIFGYKLSRPKITGSTSDVWDDKFKERTNNIIKDYYINKNIPVNPDIDFTGDLHTDTNTNKITNIQLQKFYLRRKLHLFLTLQHKSKSFTNSGFSELKQEKDGLEYAELLEIIEKIENKKVNFDDLKYYVHTTANN